MRVNSETRKHRAPLRSLLSKAAILVFGAIPALFPAYLAVAGVGFVLGTAVRAPWQAVPGLAVLALWPVTGLFGVTALWLAVCRAENLGQPEDRPLGTGDDVQRRVRLHAGPGEVHACNEAALIRDIANVDRCPAAAAQRLPVQLHVLGSRCYCVNRTDSTGESWRFFS